mmetsp:Transcript_12388/g.50778  ORF Transcript_12388/g.50778 Transcript_12388/m.50778 type:complete len:124 (-) Transcript_12388:1238-1609(-)
MSVLGIETNLGLSEIVATPSGLRGSDDFPFSQRNDQHGSSLQATKKNSDAFLRQYSPDVVKADSEHCGRHSTTSWGKEPESTRFRGLDQAAQDFIREDSLQGAALLVGPGNLFVSTSCSELKL